MSTNQEDSDPSRSEIYPEDSPRKTSTRPFSIIQLDGYKRGTFPYDEALSFSHVVFGNLEISLPPAKSGPWNKYLELPLGERLKQKEKDRKQRNERSKLSTGGYHVPLHEISDWFDRGCIAKGLRRRFDIYLLRADAMTSRIAAKFYREHPLCRVCTARIHESMERCPGCGKTLK